jgi:orotate phosphoribosyltransferase
MTRPPDQFRQEFIAFAIQKEVLRFGEFKTKAGRLSPYFFNAGLFNDGESLMKLGEFYAEAIKNSGIQFDMLFGPAYKGITLVASIAIAFAKNGVAIAIDRQEKGSGELSAVQEVVKTNQIPVCAIANLNDLLNYLQNKQDMAQSLLAVEAYRQKYGVI